MAHQQGCVGLRSTPRTSVKGYLSDGSVTGLCDGCLKRWWTHPIHFFRLYSSYFPLCVIPSMCTPLSIYTLSVYTPQGALPSVCTPLSIYLPRCVPLSVYTPLRGSYCHAGLGSGGIRRCRYEFLIRYLRKLARLSVRACPSIYVSFFLPFTIAQSQFALTVFLPHLFRSRSILFQPSRPHYVTPPYHRII